MQKNSIPRSLRKLHRAYNRLNLTHIVAFVLLACVHKAIDGDNAAALLVVLRQADEGAAHKVAVSLPQTA